VHLTTRREPLNRISEILLKRETIEADQFVSLLDGSSEEDVFGSEAPPPPMPLRRPRRARKWRAGPEAVPAAGAGRRHHRVARRTLCGGPGHPQAARVGPLVLFVRWGLPLLFVIFGSS